jgi:hypothetical protein
MKTICKHCKKEYEDTSYRINKGLSIYCSKECYNIDRKQRIREIRKCKLCGEEFEVKIKTKREFCSDPCRRKWHARPEIILQTINARNKTIKEKIDNGDVDYYKRQAEKTKKTKLERHGDENYTNTEKGKKTKLERYGDENYRDPSKRKKTCLEKYGDENYNNREKFKTTINERYGDFHLRIPEILDKQIQTRYARTLVDWEKKLKEYNLELLDDYNGSSGEYRFKCLKCENIFTSTQMSSGLEPICRVCTPVFSQNKIQHHVEQFLKDNNIKYEPNCRSLIKPYEIDIYIPEFNLGLELNGNYWHSEARDRNDKYHLNKTMMCYVKGIKLIHIFEDEWINKKSVVLSRLSNLLNITETKIYGRNCDIKEITSEESKRFIETNHIQNWSVDKYRYGLFYNDELVSVMTFSKERISMGRKTSENVWELNRFSNKINTTVIGGFSKLLKHFIKEIKPERIITYADIRWSGYDPFNTVYSKTNFVFISYSQPNYWYIDKKKFIVRQHRFNFRKDVLVKQGFDPNLTEKEIMNQRGFYRIWDCGNMKFELVLSNK